VDDPTVANILLHKGLQVGDFVRLGLALHTSPNAVVNLGLPGDDECLEAGEPWFKHRCTVMLTLLYLFLL
jgi:hypothetical protein